jgi:hypothetical protein
MRVTCCRCANFHGLAVRNPLTTARSAPGGQKLGDVSSTGHLMTGAPNMQDLVFVILILAFFALSALVVKGVERL